MRVALVALVTIMSGFIQAPAHADVSVTITDSNHQALGGCVRYDFDYNLNMPPDVIGWQATVTVDSLYTTVQHTLDSSRGDGSAGTLETPRICWWEDPVGRYPIEVKGTYTTASGAGAIAGAGFVRVSRAKTRTTITASTLSPRFNQPVRVTAEVQVKEEFGWGGAWAVDVETQIRLNGRWKDAPKLGLVTARNGRDNFYYRWNIRRPITMRFVMPKQDMFAGSVSKPITIRTRG